MVPAERAFFSADWAAAAALVDPSESYSGGRSDAIRDRLAAVGACLSCRFLTNRAVPQDQRGPMAYRRVKCGVSPKSRFFCPDANLEHGFSVWIS